MVLNRSFRHGLVGMQYGEKRFGSKFMMQKRMRREGPTVTKRQRLSEKFVALSKIEPPPQ
jgi:hypothetical protein